MNSYPTIDRTIVEPIVGSISNSVGDIDPLLDESGILRVWADSTVDDLPEDRVWRLFDLVGRRNGCSTIGLDAGASLAVRDLGSLGLQLEQCVSLFQCLTRYIETVNQYSSHASFWLKKTANGGCWFCRQGIDLIDVGRDYVEQFTLQVMIKLVRMAAGSDWIPSKIHVQASSDHGYQECQDFDRVEITTRQKVTAIWIPVDLMPTSIPIENRHAVTRQVSRLTGDFNNLACLNLADVASDLGFSERTLQRKLHAAGTDWSRLRERLRYRHALKMLCETEIRLLDLAFDLGYSDPANFGRAFRRWTGMTPGTYRRLHRPQ